MRRRREKRIRVGCRAVKNARDLAGETRDGGGDGVEGCFLPHARFPAINGTLYAEIELSRQKSAELFHIHKRPALRSVAEFQLDSKLN